MNKKVQMRGWILGLILVAALVLGAVVGSLATTKRDDPQEKVPVFVSNSTERLAQQVSFSSGFAPIVKAALPAVVNISTSKVVRAQESPFAPFFDDPFFRRFFEDLWRDIPRERRESSLGSGVIVSPDGYILTNNHVVEGASDIKVYLSDKREFKARVIGTDPRTDIAVLKIDQKNLPTLVLGDSSKLQVGEFVLAIGNPFGVGETVTMGIVSATGRGIGIIEGGEGYEDFIQTDAAINPGNSGGALINARGELIGVNTAILSRGSPGNIGIGFAVPINLARYVMEQILKSGRVIRGYLGVVIQPVTPALAKALGLKEPRGALVAEVSPNSPAAKAGIAAEDVIIEFNGEPVADSRSLRVRVAQTPPGTTVKLKLLRGGREREVTATLDELPAELQRASSQSQQERGSALEGVTVDELTPQMARRLNLPPYTRGVVVVEVRPDSPAAEAGLMSGDVIQEVNRRPINSVADFERALRQAGQDTVLLVINRRGNRLYIAIEPR
jgi:serine protease Do